MNPRNDDMEKVGEGLDPSHHEDRISQQSFEIVGGPPSEKFKGSLPSHTSKAPVSDDIPPSASMFPPQLLNPEQYLVQFDGPKDPMQAVNWPLGKK